MGLFDSYFGGGAANQMAPGGILGLLDLLKGQTTPPAPQGWSPQGPQMFPGGQEPLPDMSRLFGGGAMPSPAQSQGGGPMMPAMMPPGVMAPQFPPPVDVGGGQLPANSMPAIGGQSAPYFPPQAAPQAPAAPAAEQPSILSRIMSGLGNGLADNSSALLAFGGGTLSGGIGHGLTAAANAGELDRRARAEKQANAAIQATYDALIKSGHSPAEALAGSQNPEILKTMVTKPEWKLISKDAFGGEHYGTVKDGIPVGGAPAQTPGQLTGLGDSSLVGEDYLKQFPPEIQASVRNYINANTTPTGNPRQGFTQAVKEIAAKYGADIGHNVDETTFPQRRTMMVDLAKSTPGSAGGQITFGRTAINHLANTAESAAALDNWNGLGSADAAAAANWARGLSTEQRGKIAALNTNSQKYGQEITKFYAGSGGGEAERMGFLKSLAGTKSSTELADVLEAEKNLIPGRLHELKNKIESTLGPAGAAKYDVMSAESQKSLERIDAAIAKLRGQGAATPSTASAAPITKAAYDALPKGEPYTAPDGSRRVKQ